MKVLAAICLVLALGLGIVSHQLLKANERLGEFQIALEQATQVAADNQRVFDRAVELKDTQISEMKAAHEKSEKAVADSLARENSSLGRLAALERKLKEAISNDAPSVEWAAVRVPDAVIDGLHDTDAGAGEAHRDGTTRS